MMGLLEDSLRDTFTSRVAAAPAIEDVAGLAIRRASQVRRRRATLGSVAAVMSVLLVATGVITSHRGGGPAGTVAAPSSAEQSSPDPGATATAGQSPSPVPPVGVPLPLDVLNRDRLQVADGRVLPLSDVGTPGRAWRVTGGWLVQTYDDGAKLSGVWLVDETGARSLIASGNRTMVSRGSASRPGVQVAWKTGERLSLATFSGGGLVDRVETDGIGALSPQMFVGGGVLLGGTRTGGGIDIWDMWFPDRGAYKVTTEADDALSQVVGVSADNSRIIGLTGKPPCLGSLDPQDFTAAQSTCDLAMGLDDRISVSPNGAWWAVTSMTGVALYPTATVWTEPQLAGTLSQQVTSVAWLGTNSLIVTTQSEVLELSVPILAIRQSITLPHAGAYGNITVVEDLRS